MLSTFFFQAEDGIRDSSVTGVQTCALPIFQDVPTRWPACASHPSNHVSEAALELAEVVYAEEQEEQDHRQGNHLPGPKQRSAVAKDAPTKAIDHPNHWV